MTEESWYTRHEREATEKVIALLAQTLPVIEDDCGCEGYFSPWELFGLYGTYSGDFDVCAIEVLIELSTSEKIRHDLGAEMFREMLCVLGACSYGTSPRVCFPNQSFKALLPGMIAKWIAYSTVLWGEAPEISPPHRAALAKDVETKGGHDVGT